MCECRKGFPARVPASASVMPMILPPSNAPKIWPPVWCATTKMAEGTAMCSPQISFSRRTQVSYSASDSQWRISISCSAADGVSVDAFISSARPRGVVGASRDPTILPCVRGAGRLGAGLRRARPLPSTENGIGTCDWLSSARFQDRRRGSARRLPRRRAGRRLLLRGAHGLPCPYGWLRSCGRLHRCGLRATCCWRGWRRRGGFERCEYLALLFVEFFEDAGKIVPVETDVRGATSQLVSFEDAGKRARDAR